MPEIREMVKSSSETRPRESAVDLKQATMPDGPTKQIEGLFQSIRPQLVVAEGTVDNALPQEMQTEHALGAIAELGIRMPNKFEDQWVSQYLPRIFPWVLNYGCVGAEYPGRALQHSGLGSGGACRNRSCCLRCSGTLEATTERALRRARRTCPTPCHSK